MVLRGRVGKYVILGTLALSGGSSMHALYRNEWNVSSLSGIRLGRSIYTVMYKKQIIGNIFDFFSTSLINFNNLL